MQLYHGQCNPRKMYLPRDTVYAAIGYFDPESRQPIRFPKSECKLFMKLEEDADGFVTDRQIAVYAAMTRQNGKNIP